MRNAVHKGEQPGGIPSKGDRIELLRTGMGIRLTGTVYFSDQLQILVKWDNGFRRANGSVSTTTGFSSSACPLQERLAAADTQEMTVWGWIAVAAAAFAGLSIGVTLVIAKILGLISSGLNQMLEEESWTSAPLARAVEPPVEDLSPRRAWRAAHRSRTKS
jgi:hypothetical protein